jgi:hypothetical protein
LREVGENVFIGVPVPPVLPTNECILW